MTDNYSGVIKLDVSVRLIEPIKNTLAYANVTINNSLVVDGFSVVQGQNGLFVGMPSRPDESTKSGFREMAKPITADFRKELTDAVLGAYSAEITKLQERLNAHSSVEHKPSLAQSLADGKAKAAEHNAKISTPKKEQAVAI